MDLTGVIVELRSELESIDEAIISLGKLADLRKRRHAAAESQAAAEIAAPIKRSGRPRKEQAANGTDRYQS